MKVAIIGSGLMGSTIGGCLKLGGADVWCVDPYKEHIDAINKNGLILTLKGEDVVIPVTGVYSADMVGEKMDCVVFLVKGLYTEVAAQQAMCLADEHTCIMTLQNGFGNLEILEKYYKRENIAYGIVPYGGEMLAPGHVKPMISDGAEGKIGNYARVSTPILQEFIAVLHKSGLNINFYEEIESEVWGKFLNNCTNNAICGILRIPMGPYMDNYESKVISYHLRSEIFAIAEARGITVKVPKPVLMQKPAPGETVKPGIRPESPMYHHIPSTAQDMRRRTITEIDNLNGYASAEGKRLGIPTPYNDMVTLMVKIIQTHYDEMY